MIGQKFGKLTVIEECKERNKHGKIVYKCTCDCGNIVYANGHLLRNGNTKSCGCLRLGGRPQTHGKSYTRLYRILQHVKDRCYRSNNKDYQYYGARGIRVYDEWLNDFEAFYNWAINTNYKENLTIDRIDVNGNYEPSNCRWVDQKTQNNNKRNSVRLTYDGKTQTITQWAEELNCNRSAMYIRHRKGWTDKECLFGKGVKCEKHKV